MDFLYYYIKLSMAIDGIFWNNMKKIDRAQPTTPVLRLRGVCVNNVMVDYVLNLDHKNSLLERSRLCSPFQYSNGFLHIILKWRYGQNKIQYIK